MKIAETVLYRPFLAQTAFDPFEYSAQTAKIHYSTQNDSALLNSAKRSTTLKTKQESKKWVYPDVPKNYALLSFI
jgi:hypothetical protein